MPKTKKKTSKRKPNPAFMRPVQPDDKLAAIVGSQPLPRTELRTSHQHRLMTHSTESPLSDCPGKEPPKDMASHLPAPCMLVTEFGMLVRVAALAFRSLV